MSDTIEHWHYDHCSGLEPILKGGANFTNLKKRILEECGYRNANDPVAHLLYDCLIALSDSPSAQPYTITPDGRLWIAVDDIDKVTAVVVDEHKSKFCKQFYEDYEDAQPEIIRCKDCKLYIQPEQGKVYGRCTYPRDSIPKKQIDFCSCAKR